MIAIGRGAPSVCFVLRERAVKTVELSVCCRPAVLCAETFSLARCTKEHGMMGQVDSSRMSCVVTRSSRLSVQIEVLNPF